MSTEHPDQTTETTGLTEPLPPLDSWAAQPSSEPEPGFRSGRHPVEIGYLVMGLALLGLVAIWAVVQSDTVQGEDVRWLLPLPWVLAGVAGLVVTTLRGLRGRRDG